MKYLCIEQISERAVVIHYSSLVNSSFEIEIQNKIYTLVDAMYKLPNVVDVVVGLNNLTVIFALGTVFKLYEIDSYISSLSTDLNEKIKGKHFDILVNYGGISGPDLHYVANYHQITPQEVVEIHTAPVYQVYSLGFQAGFPYLGELDSRLITPRRDIPRTEISAGSVGIGGAQTGIYPLASPGGWQIIGCCDLQLFNPLNNPPALLSPNDTIRFVAQTIIVD